MKKIVPRFVVPLIALSVASWAALATASKTSEAPSGTLETFIVERGTLTMNLDVNRLNGLAAENSSTPTSLRFEAAPNSFLPVLVFNDELRGPTPGSVALNPQNSALLPAALNASFHQLVFEKLEAGGRFDVVIRDAKTGFTFFGIEGNVYDYDRTANSFKMNGGRLLLSEEFAKVMGRPSDTDVAVGTVSMTASMQMIESKKVVNGEVTETRMPVDPNVGTTPGPDVIVGDLPAMSQSGSAGTQVGLAIATTSCNAGVVDLNWFAMPNTDHPVIPQNLYRMNGGASNTERFEQIGQGWMKHAFTALTQNICNLGCNGTGGTHLGSGCSDPYDTGLNGSQTGIGSRAFVNPFTGVFPSTARDHSGHTHSGTTHRVLVNQSDLNTTLNPGASYFGEAQYVTPHEYAWCQSHAGQCNMYNNVSYRKFTVAGTTSFSFTPAAATVRTQPAIFAWTGATQTQFKPAPGEDGIGFVAYKVSGPTSGVYHYEYVVFNENLDRAIQSFSIPLGCGVNGTLTNVDMKFPQNHPGIANDGSLNSAGYSNAPWTLTQNNSAISWASETFAQNQNANALRWGTAYTYRFDSTQPPAAMNATIGFFKTGQPITVAIQGPSAVCTPFSLTTAVSRKTHGSAGTFDIDLPLSGSPGVECRNSGGNHMIVITFSNTVVSGNAAVTSGTGTVAGSPTFAGNVMTVNVTGVPTAQQITLTFSGVTDSFGQTYPDTPLVMKALLGDANGNSAVSTSDVAIVKSEASNPVTQSNFREDLTADGNVSSSDVGAVKSMAGATLP